MANNTTATNVPAKAPAKAVDAERQARWEAFLAAYEKQNPVKYAAKKAAGEFDKVPDSFA